jgi:S1-C subfamily serine protease
VVVRDVLPESPAAQRGLEPGDIILRVNKQPVTT